MSTCGDAQKLPMMEHSVLVGNRLTGDPPQQAAETVLPRPSGAFATGPVHRARCAGRRCGVSTITDVGDKWPATAATVRV